MRQKARGPVQAQTAHGGGNGLAIQRVVHPVPVVGREVRHLGKAGEVQRLIEMVVDVGLDPAQALLVVGHGLRVPNRWRY